MRFGEKKQVRCARCNKIFANILKEKDSLITYIPDLVLCRQCCEIWFPKDFIKNLEDVKDGG